MLSISVVICAYTEARWDELVASVKSVQQQTIPPLEIIIVIDHNPALLERVRARIPGAVVVANTEPRGLAGARNSGVAAARGEVIAFLDEDSTAAPDWLARISAGYAGQVIGVGGAIVPVWLAGRPRWFPTEFDWVVGCTFLGMPETSSRVRNLIGCNMSFQRQTFDQVGGFTSGIGRVGTRPVGCEETEFCIRTRQHSPKSELLFDAQARVYHQVPPSRATLTYFCSRCYAEGLSKALVSRLVGAQDGLASERTYTMQVLPRGVVRGLADTLLRRDPFGLARAGAIVAGLALTTAGFLIGTVSGAWAKRLQDSKTGSLALSKSVDV